MSDIAGKFPTRDQIEVRAYEIYLARGAEDGYDVADWVMAERELSEMVESMRSSEFSSVSPDQTNDILANEPLNAEEEENFPETEGKRKAAASGKS